MVCFAKKEIAIILLMTSSIVFGGCSFGSVRTPEENVMMVESEADRLVGVYQDLKTSLGDSVSSVAENGEGLKKSVAVEIKEWDDYCRYALDYLTGSAQNSVNPVDAPVGSCEAVSGAFHFGSDISAPDAFLPQNGALSESYDVDNRNSSSLSSYENGNGIERAFFERCNSNTNNLLPVQLSYVVDGDTLAVRYDGEDYRVRLIGVNTAESVAREEYLESTGKENTEEGKLASSFVKDLLAGRETVWLEFDQELYDRYGRVLAYVYLDDAGNIQKNMLECILLQEGYAEIMSIEPNVKYKEQLEAIASP